jgi:hypothetical protein
VVAVFRELPASVAALDRLGLSLTMTLNDGAVAAQNCYARRDRQKIRRRCKLNKRMRDRRGAGMGRERG